ncbi:MAG TPA: hypothetical protein DEP84_32160 [Chloroflexi bacterium]|nr:hypothetical protein [Chloroflexota bacterium]
MGSWLTRRSNDLLPFDDVRQRLRAHAQHDGGLQQVPITQIIGSVGRYRDFDRAFLPRQQHTRNRWLNIDRAYYDDVHLPPIELYQLGETYFVKDGNHRVSVARERGQEFIDAYVIEAHAPAPIASVADLEAWIRHQDALDFLATTQLSQLRPAARVELTLPGQYEKLLEHIAVHRWYLGIERNREIPYHEAVASWYDRVYLPLVEIIRTSGALREFPHRTEADLYLWTIERHWYLRQAGVLAEDHPLDELIRDYAEEFSERPARRFAKAVRRTAQRVAMELSETAEAVEQSSAGFWELARYAGISDDGSVGD